MYVNKLNLQTNGEIIKAYVSKHGFATIVSIDGEDFTATHTALMMDEEGQYLYGHIARPNGQAGHITNGTKVMALFMDTHTYISSSWYDHINVPTWNYIAVHVYGSFIELTREETIESLKKLVSKYETGRENAFSVDKMDERMLNSNLRGLIAFKIKIEKIDAAWKLSQNRDDKNHAKIISRLKQEGDYLSIEIAKAMEEDRPK
jgi:transcriptional regulator